MNFYLKQIVYWIKWKSPIYEEFLRGKKVLDMWCWEWKLLKKDKKNIYWIDLNKTEINRLKNDWFNVKLEWITETSYKNEEFDIIMSDNVIEHLFPNDANLMFIEMNRILKKGWKIYLKTPLEKIIWNTFWHIKPYTPSAISKLFRENSRETFGSIWWLKIEKVYYYGWYSKNKIIFLLNYLIAIFIPYFRTSYLLIIKKI